MAPERPPSSTFALLARSLVRRYGEVLALDGVTLELSAGTVLGVVGENGAGKSTLLDILSGGAVPDAGGVTVWGTPLRSGDRRAAAAQGIGRVYQEQALVAAVPVYENLLLGAHEKFVRFGQIVRRRAMIEMADAMMGQAGASIDVRRPTADLTFSERQVVEIVRASLAPTMLFGAERPIVLFDEPTASLEKADERIFRDLVARTRAAGAALLVSHRLGEVLELSDRVLVLKDGRVAGLVDPAEAGEADLHRLMVGRERDADYYHEASQRDDERGAIAFAARGLSAAGAYASVDLSVREGEILGIGGLLESGKSALGKGLAGVAPPDRGEVRLGEGGWQRPAVRALMSAGVGYVPSERLVEGMIAPQPIAWNITLASTHDLFSGRFGLWRHRHEQRVSEALMRRLSVKAASPRVRCAQLSGGNQQKVVLARFLARQVRVLVLDNPTRGVDAGAKEEIYGLLRALAETGVAVVLITDELLELIHLSNRIAIMRHGEIVAVVPAPHGAKPTEHRLVELMLTAERDLAQAVAA